MSQCPSCQQEIEPSGPYCPRCGAPLQAPAVPPPPPPGSGQGQGYYQGGSGQADPGPPITAQDWQDFLGPNAGLYLPKFARFGPPGQEKFVATWHWPAFLATFWWFLYRKQYLWFGLCLVGVFVPFIKFAVWIGAAVAANYIYFIEAQKQIRAIKATSPPDQLSLRLAQAGGVHTWVPWVAALVSGGLFLLTMVLMMFVGGLTMGWFMGMANSH